MAFVKKTWKDRISQYPNRRTINDGIISKNVTVSRNEGTVTEPGTSFNAENMNDLEDRINEAFTNIVHMPRVNDKAPYQYRQIPVKANRSYEKLIGVSCAFNQLFTATASGTYDSILTTFDSATGTLHSSGTTASTYYFFVTGAEHKIPIISGHKYYVHIDDTRTVRYAVFDGGTNRNIVDKIGATIINSTYDGWLSLVSMNNTVGASVDITCKPNVIDLTAMFGSEVADYLYNLENS